MWALRWVESPLSSLSAPDFLLAAVSASEEVDFWFFVQSDSSISSFPVFLGNAGYCPLPSVRVKRWSDLWGMEKLGAVLESLLAEFIELSRQHEFCRVLVVISMGHDIRVRDQGFSASYTVAIEYFQKRFGDELRIVDVLETTLESERFYVRPFAGHASPHGNRVLAEILNAVLERGQ